MRKIVIWVVWSVHAVFALLLIVQPSFSPQKKEHKTLLVKTITPKAQPKTVVAASASAPIPKKKAVAPPKPKPVAAAPAKKPEPAIADKVVSKTKKTPAAAPKKPEPKRAAISDDLWQELEQSFAKIEQKGSKPTPQYTSALTLQIDTASSDEEGSYVEKLVGHLHQALQLPDYGEVKIQLSLRQDGSVVKIVVLRAQSQKNKRYLEENLPHLRFPRFEGSLLHKQESSFVLTFVNEV